MWYPVAGWNFYQANLGLTPPGTRERARDRWIEALRCVFALDSPKIPTGGVRSRPAAFSFH